jgi:FtsP/CotA-like multicopper oxidase with cupredoxin domain
MVRIGPMARPEFPLDRRELMAGLGALALTPAYAPKALTQGRSAAALQLKPEVIGLLAGGGPDTPVWSLGGPALRFKRGETIEIGVGNELPVPAILNWWGIDGAGAAEPLTGRSPIAAGGRDTFPITPRHAGTYFCDAGIFGDGQSRPVRGRPLIVSENEPVPVGRDEVLLIEEWRLRPDGTAIAPGNDPGDTKPLYTFNGQTSFELSASGNERLRLRFINASQRTVLAIKLENHEVRVMALDGQPAEPFEARSGALVLAPGGRADAFVDTRVTGQFLLHDGKEAVAVGRLAISGYMDRRAPLLPAAPLPSNGLPAQLDLKNAQRFEITFGGTQTDWVIPTRFAATSPPAFRAKAGRTVALALTNRAATATVFHLHGHHFRLLDRLDDGWKPFWLDTLAVEPGQTQRVAFSAEYAGRWLIESTATDWAAPRLVRWYTVE